MFLPILMFIPLLKKKKEKFRIQKWHYISVMYLKFTSFSKLVQSKNVNEASYIFNWKTDSLK